MLVDIGINLSEVSMGSDKVSKPSRYDDDKVYHFEKEISFAATANLAILEEQLTQNEYDVFVSLRNGLTILEIAQKLDFFAKAVAMKR